MKSIKFISVLIILVTVGFWMTVRALTVFIPVGNVGVRIQQYSIFGQKGVVEKDYGPGWHRDLGPIDDWEIYDSTVQTLEMTKDPGQGSAAGRDDVKVQSVEGNNISLDVTVKYRIKDGLANKLYRDTGKGTKYRTIVRVEAEESCMKEFGTLSTEDFYSPEAKRGAASNVLDVLTVSLENNYVEIVDVLIRDIEFDQEYEAKIRKKKLADQEVQLNISMARAEEMSGKRQVIEAETAKLLLIIAKEKDAELTKMQAQNDLDVEMIRAAYKKYATEKQADANLVKAQKGAEGTILVNTAEAEGERLRNEAIQGAGGSVIVALEAARNLNMKNATISTLDVDLLDVDGMAGKLGLDDSQE